MVGMINSLPKKCFAIAGKKGTGDKTNFEIMNYSATNFPGNSFDVIWGCESICYADSKELFIKEAYRLLKPGGRLVVADGFVTDFKNNDDIVVDMNKFTEVCEQYIFN